MSSSTALFIYSHKYTCIYMQLYASRLKTLVAVAVVGTQSVKHITTPFHAAIHFPALLAAIHRIQSHSFITAIQSINYMYPNHFTHSLTHSLTHSQCL